MISQRPTWWMYLVGASFLLVHLLQAYLSIWGPAFPQGLDATFEPDAMRVRSVEPETLFARGGLQSGDRVLAVDGLPVRSPREWSAVLANVEAEQGEIWVILRNGNRIDLAVTFPRATWENRIHSGVVEYDAVNFAIFLFGLFIGFARPRDLAARIGAWLFLTASVAFGFMNGWAVIWRQAPLPVQFALGIPEVSRFTIDGIFLSFFAIFAPVTRISVARTFKLGGPK